ncbi:CLUMA_CG015235, isoform A, partial [Clunio marinus]
ICGKCYKLIAPFLHHIKCHDNRFDFPCRYCEKKFRVSRDRMLHERTHTGDFFLCTITTLRNLAQNDMKKLMDRKR